jgi:hypothetical protein
MWVTNTGAYRSTSPKGLKKVADPIGPENRKYIIDAAMQASLVVVGCGALELPSMRTFFLSVAEDLITSGAKLHALATTQAGWPGHPLYLPLNVEPRPWHPSADLLARFAANRGAPVSNLNGEAPP